MSLKHRFNRRVLSALLCAFAFIALFINCDGQFATQSLSSSSSISASLSESCGPGGNEAPNSIDEAVELINRLPKPLTVPCFLSQLHKPFQIFAVDNAFSAQPSQGPENPRIFIFNGNLAISVVPSGPGRDVVEFAEITATTKSVKGEIAFPVKETLPSSAPYSRIIEGVQRTSCSVCHQNESRATNITAGEAYNSEIIKPDPFKQISQQSLLSVSRRCDPQQDAERCQILDAIFISGKAQDKAYPSGPQ